MKTCEVVGCDQPAAWKTQDRAELLLCERHSKDWCEYRLIGNRASGIVVGFVELQAVECDCEIVATVD